MSNLAEMLINVEAEQCYLVALMFQSAIVVMAKRVLVELVAQYGFRFAQFEECSYLCAKYFLWLPFCKLKTLLSLLAI